jgi:hypothetical protein
LHLDYVAIGFGDDVLLDVFVLAFFQKARSAKLLDGNCLGIPKDLGEQAAKELISNVVVGVPS